MVFFDELPHVGDDPIPTPAKSDFLNVRHSPAPLEFSFPDVKASKSQSPLPVFDIEGLVKCPDDRLGMGQRPLPHLLVISGPVQLRSAATLW
jgi:hypothetical protein